MNLNIPVQRTVHAEGQPTGRIGHVVAVEKSFKLPFGLVFLPMTGKPLHIVHQPYAELMAAVAELHA